MVPQFHVAIMGFGFAFAKSFIRNKKHNVTGIQIKQDSHCSWINCDPQCLTCLEER